MDIRTLLGARFNFILKTSSTASDLPAWPCQLTPFLWHGLVVFPNTNLNTTWTNIMGSEGWGCPRQDLQGKCWEALETVKLLLTYFWGRANEEAPVQPPPVSECWGWIFWSYYLIVRHRRKWNFEVHFRNDWANRQLVVHNYARCIFDLEIENIKNNYRQQPSLESEAYFPNQDANMGLKHCASSSCCYILLLSIALVLGKPHIMACTSGSMTAMCLNVVNQVQS